MTFASDLNFDFLRELFGVGRGEDDRAVICAARDVSPLLLELVIAVAAREGVPIGSGSADELRRAHVRADHYDLLYTEIVEEVQARIVKGRSIAGCYPPDLVRPSADLHLLLPDETALWSAARVVCGREDVERIDVAILRRGGRTQVVLGLGWPTEDPLLDEDFDVELSTVALAGDYLRVPPAAALPEDDSLANLLCLADARFQREFTVKDVLDVLMVFDRRPPRPDELARVAVEWSRAPELAELLTLAHATLETLVLAECVERLRAPAKTELRRRPAVATDVPATVAGRLEHGLPVHGLLLGEARRDWPASRLRELNGRHLLRAPIGDFLLMGGGLDNEGDYQAAVLELGLSPS